MFLYQVGFFASSAIGESYSASIWFFNLDLDIHIMGQVKRSCWMLRCDTELAVLRRTNKNYAAHIILLNRSQVAASRWPDDRQEWGLKRTVSVYWEGFPKGWTYGSASLRVSLKIKHRRATFFIPFIWPGLPIYPDKPCKKGKPRLEDSAEQKRSPSAERSTRRMMSSSFDRVGQWWQASNTVKCRNDVGWRIPYAASRLVGLGNRTRLMQNATDKKGSMWGWSRTARQKPAPKRNRVYV